MYFHCVIKYGLIFGGFSSNSGKIFILQKEIIRIMAGGQPRTSCGRLFKQLEILPVQCQYMLLLMNFIISNKEIFETNSSVHNINTRNKYHLHRLNAKLPCFQKGIFSAGTKIFKSMKILKHEKVKFKASLRKYLCTHSSYSVDEFLCVKMMYNTAFVKCL